MVSDDAEPISLSEAPTEKAVRRQGNVGRERHGEWRIHALGLKPSSALIWHDKRKQVCNVAQNQVRNQHDAEYAKYGDPYIGSAWELGCRRLQTSDDGYTLWMWRGQEPADDEAGDAAESGAGATEPMSSGADD